MAERSSSPNTNSYISWFIFWGKRLVRSWFKLQVNHRGGTYSLERLLALEEYTRTTSPLRVALVCLGTPLPIVMIVLAQELIPLQDPKEGSLANYVFWIRVGLVTGVVAYTAAVQAQFYVDRVKFTYLQLFLVFCCVGVMFPVVTFAISTAVVFPIPFIMISALPVFYAVLIASFRLTAGRQFFHDIAADRSQLVKYVAFIGIQGLMIIVYPVYQTLFTAASQTNYEVAVIFLLPLIKMMMKYLLSICTTHLEDLMPEAVIFTAEFFNALYVATSMQRASALTTVVTMATVDFCQAIFSLYNLHHHTSTVLTRLQESIGAQEGNLVASISALCRKPELWRTKAGRGIRVRSTFPYALSDTTRKVIHSIAEISNDHNSKQLVSRRLSRDEQPRSKGAVFNEIVSIQPTPNAGVRFNRSARIQPFVSTNTPPSAADLAKTQVIASKRSIVHTPSHRNFLTIREALESLFTSECMVLMEYLEFVIPMLYGLFVLIMVRLPNLPYHLDLEGMTTSNVNPTVLCVFALGLLETISFVVLAIVMRRNCGLNAVYQLAFVLETQVMLVQGKVATWVLITLAFRVEHFGADLTFEFDWIGK